MKGDAMQHKLLALLLMIAVGIGPNRAVNAAPPVVSIPAALHSPAVAQAWMELLYERVSVIGIYPPTAARVYAYAGVALYEAVAVGSPTLASLSTHLTAMPTMPEADPAMQYDWPAVVNAAVAKVSEPVLIASPVRTMFNTMHQEQVRQHIKTLRNRIVEERLQQVDPTTMARSTALGDAIGQAIANWAATDGFAETHSTLYEVPTGDEAFWVPIPRHLEPIEPYWHTLRPLLLSNGEECAVPLAVQFSTAIDSPFYRQAMEVYHTSIRLTTEEKEIAEFWDDQAGEAGMHPGHWLLIANQLIAQDSLTLAEAAEILMMTGLAVHEAGIVAWTGKYSALVIRPETYIQRYIDPTWEPFLDTPNFPEYPSGHATFGAATAEVITGLRGTIAFTDNGGIIQGMGRARSFTSLEAAAYENGLSRLYGGIHYRVGMEAGLRSGQCIGQRILEELSNRNQ